MARSPAPLVFVAVISSLWLCLSCTTSQSGITPEGTIDAPIRIDARTSCDDGGPGTAGCDPFLSCGCGDQQKCAPGDQGLTCDTAGPKLSGEACADDTACGRGTTCVSYAGATTCHAFCDDVHPCQTGACYIASTDRAGKPAGMLCGPTCSLLAEDCPASLGCYPFAGAPDADHGVCLKPGVGVQGATCSRGSDCAIGFACIDPSGPSPAICARMCDRTSGSGCDAKTEGTCHPFASSSADSQTGVCLP